MCAAALRNVLHALAYLVFGRGLKGHVMTYAKEGSVRAQTCCLLYYRLCPAILIGYELVMPCDHNMALKAV